MQVQVQEIEQTGAGQLSQPLGTENSRLARIRGFAPPWLRSLTRNRKAVLGFVIVIGFILTAVFAPRLAPYDPSDFVARPHLAPSSDYWFGTTGQGQDVLSQTIWGSRFMLEIGFLVGICTTVVGTILGMTAGYFRGVVDEVISVLTNIFLIIPSLPLLVVLAAFLGSGDLKFFVLVLTLTGWAFPARVIRSQTMSLREKDFVSASVVSGEKNWRIIFLEILPNMLSIIVASFIGSTIFSIGAQAALEFLGLGNPSRVTWGTNLYWASNNAGLLTGAWWTFVPAGVCIALLAFAFALMNYGIDEITNPRLRARLGINRVLKERGITASAGRATPVVRKTA